VTPQRAAEIGKALFEAERSRSQIGLISQANPDMTMDDAYAVQDAFVQAKKDAGAVQRGWKIGLTSKAMRDALKIDIPTGALRKITDTIADNAANAGIALGGRPIAVDDVDMRWIGAIVSRNAEVEETGLGAGVLNQPAQGIAWLANRLAAYGETLRAGDVVLSGSFVRPVECPHGSTLLADFGEFGSVSLYFA